MNEIIEHCMYESGLTADGCWNELDDYAKEAIKRFAVLIIQECTDWINNNVGMVDADAKADLLKHFGVEG